MAERPLSSKGSEDPFGPPPQLLSSAEWEELVRALGLSRREAEIVAAILDGRRDREIAQELSISVHTVHSHIRRIYGKLRVPDRAALVARLFADYANLRRRSREGPLP